MPAHALHLVQTGASPGKQHDGLLHLAKNVNIHPDAIIGDGNEIVGTGKPGSGKTTVMARLLEQFGECSVPFSAFDLEGDLGSIVGLLPRGVQGTIDNCPTAQDMYQGGLQVVFDLSTWGEDSNHAARFISRIVADLMAYMKALPHNARVPFLVGLDEAAYWLPQIRKGKDYLSPSQFEALFSAFHTLAIRGRKMGLFPVLFTQRIASLHKDVLSPGTYIFLCQTTDNDLKRYMEYISPAAFGDEEMTEKQMRHRIAAFRSGQAVIKLASGKQGLVQFYDRESPHKSHTPKTQTAQSLYRDVPFDPKRQYGSDHVEAEVYPKASPMGLHLAKSDETPDQTARKRTVKEQVFALLDADPNITPSTLAVATGGQIRTMQSYRKEYIDQHSEPGERRGPTIKEQVFALLETDPKLSNTTMATLLKRPTNTIQLYRNEYFVQHPDKKLPPKPMGKIEMGVRAQLAENPNYTASQIAYRTGYAKKDINRVLARIQAETEGVQP